MKTKKLKTILTALMCMILLSVMAVSVFATGGGSGDVAGAIQGTWDTAKVQIKTVVNNVVFPVIDLILAVLFFAKLAMSYMDYRQRGHFEWAPAAILFATLVFSLTAPLYIWGIIGM